MLIRGTGVLLGEQTRREFSPSSSGSVLDVLAWPRSDQCRHPGCHLCLCLCLTVVGVVVVFPVLLSYLLCVHRTAPCVLHRTFVFHRTAPCIDHRTVSFSPHRLLSPHLIVHRTVTPSPLNRVTDSLCCLLWFPHTATVTQLLHKNIATQMGV